MAEREPKSDSNTDGHTTQINKPKKVTCIVSFSKYLDLGFSKYQKENRLNITFIQSLSSRLEMSEIRRSALCIVLYLPYPASLKKLYFA